MKVAEAAGLQRVARLMGNAVSETVVAMVLAGQIEPVTGVQILERLEARLKVLSRQLGQTEPAQGRSAHRTRCFSTN